MSVNTLRLSRPLQRLVVPAAGVLLLLGGLWARPGSGPAQTPGAQVSPDSILAVARDLAGETGVGPPSRVAARPSTDLYVQYLRDRLAGAIAPLGGTVSLDPYSPDFDYQGPETVRDPYTNVVGFIPGRLGDAAPGSFLFGAHFDSDGSRTSDTWNAWTDPAPGADDNASGVAAILEAARVLAARGERPDVGLYFVFFDGEEQQRLGGSATSLTGSEHFASQDLNLLGVVNLDMVSFNPDPGGIDSLVVITNLTSRWLAEEVLLSRDREALSGLHLTRLVKGLNNSDHASFWEQGVPAIMLIENESIVDFQPTYHRASDTVANSYVRNASQVVSAAELLVGLVESVWSGTGLDALTITDEDVLFQQQIGDIRVQDAASVEPGEDVEIVHGVTNLGGTRTAPWTVEVFLEALDGTMQRRLETRTLTDDLPAGTRHELVTRWTPRAEDLGVLRARVVLRDPADGDRVLGEGTRTVAVQGPDPEVVRSYVYPNPTTLPADALLHYELAAGGGVRITLLDVTGREVATRDYGYDRVFPDPQVDVGAAEVPLGEILNGRRLAPGLYLARIEAFRESGTSASVSITRFAVLR